MDRDATARHDPVADRGDDPRADRDTGPASGRAVPRSLERTPVRELMQTKIVTIAVNERLSTVEDIMRLGRVRHMPVVQGGSLVGVVSERDLLRASLSQLSSAGNDERRAFLAGVQIKQVMSAPPVVCASGTTAGDAALILAEAKIGCLPVVDGGELVGLVTETDLLLHFAGLA